MMHEDLKDKVAIVTGASRGLGREYAEKLAAAGANVVAADISDCSETTQSINENGGNSIAVELDVRQQKSCDNMADSALKSFGHIDILVNNAALYGSLKGGRFDVLREDDWNDCMNVNVNGIWRCCKSVIEPLKSKKSGSIINISSLAALAGLPYALHYSTSKAAVIGMTRALARELGRDWIRVNSIAPSAVLTEGTDEFSKPVLLGNDKGAIAETKSIPRRLSRYSFVFSERRLEVCDRPNNNGRWRYSIPLIIWKLIRMIQEKGSSNDSYPRL